MTDDLTPTGSAPLVARGPDDLLAMVPLALGFVPCESVTMLTFAARRPFHARIDLPDRASDDPDLVEALVEPARRHGVRRVALVVHTTRPQRFRQVAGALLDALLTSGVDVVEVLRAEAERYWCLDCDHTHGACGGHEYDVGAHPFAVRAVVSGRVLHASREELAATLLPDPATGARQPRVREGAMRHDCRLASGDLAREATWIHRTLRRHLLDDTRPDDVRLGRLLADLQVVALRDAVWDRMTREDARGHVELWRDVVRRSPGELLPAAAGVLGYAAWLAGDGALAWCAVDRGREDGHDLDLLAFVAGLLAHAVSPEGGEPDARREPA